VGGAVERMEHWIQTIHPDNQVGRKIIQIKKLMTKQEERD
jgi:hypothetical protein